MKKIMLINVLQPEECRIAILENNVLEELYVERSSHESYVGNIYKGRIVNIEPSIQAAFVDFGVGRNGFLHVSDVEPTYYRHLDGGNGDEDSLPRQRGGQRRGAQPPKKHIPDVEDYPLEPEIVDLASNDAIEQEDATVFHEPEVIETGDFEQESNPDSVTFGPRGSAEQAEGPDEDSPPAMPSANRITDSDDEDDLLFSKPTRGDSSESNEGFSMEDEIADVVPENETAGDDFSFGNEGDGSPEPEVVQETGFPDSPSEENADRSTTEVRTAASPSLGNRL